MSIRRLATLAVVAALGLLSLGSGSVSATTFLKTDTGAGAPTPLTGNTTIRNTTADPAVLEMAVGTVTCNQTFFDADVNSNSSATTIGGKLTSLTFTSCTDTLLAVNFPSCRLQTASVPTVHIAGTATGGNITLGHTVVRCANGTTPTGCYFTSVNIAGTATNVSSSIDFVGSVTAVVPPGVTDAAVAGNCGSTGNLAVKATHIVSATNGTITVTTA